MGEVKAASYTFPTIFVDDLDVSRIVRSLAPERRVPLEDMAKLYDKHELGITKVFVETTVSSPPMPGCPKTSRVYGWSHSCPGVTSTSFLGLKVVYV